MVDYISPLIKPIGIVFYIIFIVDLSPLHRGIVCKDRAFMEGAALVNVWVAPQKLLPKWQMDGIQPCLVLICGLLLSPTVIRKKTTHIGHFYTLLILIPYSKMSMLAPTEPGSLQYPEFGSGEYGMACRKCKSQPN